MKLGIGIPVEQRFFIFQIHTNILMIPGIKSVDILSSKSFTNLKNKIQKNTKILFIIDEKKLFCRPEYFYHRKVFGAYKCFSLKSW